MRVTATCKACGGNLAPSFDFWICADCGRQVSTFTVLAGPRERLAATHPGLAICDNSEVTTAESMGCC